MFIKIAILISIGLLVLSAILAISMIKKAKFNISWIFLTLALLLMALRRVFEYVAFVFDEISPEIEIINNWFGVFTALFISLSLVFIKKIFNLIKTSEKSRLLMEKKILSAIVRTEENERKRFAKDLHDGLGPLLSNLKMSVSTLERIENRKEMDEILENMKEVSIEAINGIKQISNNLSPHILENFGIIHALENFSKTIEINCKTRIKIISNFDDLRFPYNIEIVLYRVINELINNTIKHSKATEIQILLNKIGEKLEIEYSDNGIGFDSNKIAHDHSGMGISNIKSRIKTINGRIDLFSDENGSQAIISCPVKL